MVSLEYQQVLILSPVVVHKKIIDAQQKSFAND